jgi:hypothetical protein
MGEIVNLREYRKRRKRDQKHEEAATNRAVHGQTKQDIKQQTLEKEQAEQVHVSHRIERDTEEPA